MEGTDLLSQLAPYVIGALVSVILPFIIKKFSLNEVIQKLLTLAKSEDLEKLKVQFDEFKSNMIKDIEERFNQLENKLDQNNKKGDE